LYNKLDQELGAAALAHMWGCIGGGYVVGGCVGDLRVETWSFVGVKQLFNLTEWAW
jgi:hypothetical protein